VCVFNLLAASAFNSDLKRVAMAMVECGAGEWRRARLVPALEKTAVANIMTWVDFFSLTSIITFLLNFASCWVQTLRN
jgi:hypothetical protein